MALHDLQQLRAQVEASFMAAAADPTTLSWTVGADIKLLRVHDLDWSGLVEPREADRSIQPRVGIQPKQIPLSRAGQTWSFGKYLSPLGTAAGDGVQAGETELGWLLSKVLGISSRPTGTTISGAGSTTTVLAVASAAGILAGDILLVPDTIGGVATHSPVIVSAVDTGATPDTVTVFPALGTAPANGVVVYACASYGPQDVQPTTMAFLLQGDQQTDERITLGTAGRVALADSNPGQIPRLTFDMTAGHWVRPITGTGYSSAFATDAFLDKQPKFVGGAGLWMGDLTGDDPTTPVTTRTRYNEEGFTADFGVSVTPDPSSAGTAGVGSLQGMVRDAIAAKGSALVDHDDIWQAWFETNAAKFMLRAFHVAPGSSVGIFMPRIFPNETPKREATSGKKTGDRISWIASEGPTASALLRSPWRIWLG